MMCKEMLRAVSLDVWLCESEWGKKRLKLQSNTVFIQGTCLYLCIYTVIYTIYFKTA